MNIHLPLARKPSGHIEDYLLELESIRRSPNTLRSYRTALYQWRASGLTPKVFLQRQSDEGLKPRSVNTRRAILHAYFSWLNQNALVRENPLQQTRMVTIPTRLRPTLTVGEVARLLDACSGLNRDAPLVSEEAIDRVNLLPIEAYRARLAAMIAMQVTAGLRVSELCKIETERVDMDGRWVTVIRKGDKEQRLRFGRVGRDKVSAWMEFRSELPGPYLFCSRRGALVDPRSYNRQLHQACWLAEIPAITPHALRRTFATLAVDSGIPMRDVQEMLGHANLATTEIYIQRREKDVWKRYGSHVLELDVESVEPVE
jgi:site-specific recombinase XerD